jgi:small-conductance mechanosensitive channel
MVWIGQGRRLRHAGILLLAVILAVIVLIAVQNWHGLVSSWLPAGPLRDVATKPGTELASEAVLLILAVLAIVWVMRQVVRQATQAATPYLGLARAQMFSRIAMVLFYLLVVPLVAWSAGIELTGLAIPGALTGVIIAIAAQASLSNLIAGLVILFTRPYVEGMSITARAPGLAGGEYSGLITSIGLFYTAMRVGDREVRLPNSALVQGTVIVRPQEVEVYVPVVLAPQTDCAAAMTDLRRMLLAALPPRRTVTLVLERIDAAGYAIGIHASVASETEQQTLTAELARFVARMIVPPMPVTPPSTAPVAPPTAPPAAESAGRLPG